MRHKIINWVCGCVLIGAGTIMMLDWAVGNDKELCHAVFGVVGFIAGIWMMTYGAVDG